MPLTPSAFDKKESLVRPHYVHLRNLNQGLHQKRFSCPKNLVHLGNKAGHAQKVLRTVEHTHNHTQENTHEEGEL